jgi:hypothetical protein
LDGKYSEKAIYQKLSDLDLPKEEECFFLSSSTTFIYCNKIVAKLNTHKICRGTSWHFVSSNIPRFFGSVGFEWGFWCSC